MSKRANPKLIGGFVLGAIALVIGGLLAFGGGQYFAPKGRAVLYFAGSLAGLDVGSPVTFRGVKVGTVTRIVIQYDVREQKLRIPVYIELNPEKFQIITGKRSETNIKELVQRGLRAQLQVQSLVTGQTSVDFDFYPDTPIHMVAEATDELELPTIPSNIDMLKANLTALLAKISKLPLEQISAGLVDAIASANQMLKQAQTVVQGAGGLVTDLNDQVKPLSDSVLGVSTDASQMLQEARKRLELRDGEPMQNLNVVLLQSRKLVDDLNRDLPRLLGPTVQALTKATAALDQAQALVAAAQRFISPGSPIYFEFNSTLTEFKTAARAIRVFAEYIQRNPNALLTGNK
ncbi:MAG TPA: MlaD family protein [Verrucomicrobiae bacterium]|nr:MlaD family protein [Verrucomicrobiae bacterium]